MRARQKPEQSENRSNRKIFLGAVCQYLYLALTVVSGLLFTPLISNHYGQDQYGLISICSGFVALFTTDIGLSYTANRFLSQYKAEGKTDQIRSLLGLMYKIYLVLDAVLFLILLTCYFFLGDIFQSLATDQMETFKGIYLVSGICTIFIFPMTSFAGVLNAYEEYSVEKLLAILEKLLYICFVSMAIAFDWSIIFVSLITSGCALITYSIKYLYIRGKLKLKADMSHSKNKKLFRLLFSFSVWIAVGSICSRIGNYISSPILGMISPDNSGAVNSAVFTVGGQIESYAFHITCAFLGFFLPKVSRIFASETGERRTNHLFALSVKVALISSSLLVLVTVGFASCGQEFIQIWMGRSGQDYSLSYWVGLILILCHSQDWIIIIQNNSLFYQNNVKHYGISQLVKAVIFVAGAFVLGYYFGAIGVALAALLPNIFAIGYVLTVTKKQYGLKIWAFYKNVYGRQIIPVCIMLAVGLCMHFYLPISDIYRVIVIAVTLTLLFVVLYWFLVFPKDLKVSILNIFKGKRATEPGPSENASESDSSEEKQTDDME